MKNVFKKAYTLAEVIIVMLIIAVVVSVTIKLTKAKLDNITSYTYYSAYNTVRAVAAEMLRDFDAEEDDYAITLNKFFLPVYDYVISLNRFFQPAYGVANYCPVGCTLRANPACWQGEYSKEKCCDCGKENPTPNDKMMCMNGQYAPDCPAGASVDLRTCTCKFPLPEPNPDKPNVKPSDCAWNVPSDINGNPMCPTGTTPNYSTCNCDKPLTPLPDDIPDLASCPSVIPCGKECNAETGFVLKDIVGFSRTCDDRTKQWNETQCGCIPTPQTVSRNGAGFCRLFVNYSNTARLAEGDECQGDQINNGETDFADKEPDMILRNGMFLYNVSQDPEPIAELAGNSKGITYIDSQNREVNVDTWGYKLYVDIDGVRGGSGTLWEDVYPFYVTLSGTVIPAYDINNPETAGGDSKLHLQTSVHDEFVDANGRHTQWITKSTTFKDSACTMGYVNAATPYCQGVALNAQCSTQNHDCRLKTVMPIKFFGF